MVRGSHRGLHCHESARRVMLRPHVLGTVDRRTVLQLLPLELEQRRSPIPTDVRPHDENPAADARMALQWSGRLEVADAAGRDPARPRSVEADRELCIGALFAKPQTVSRPGFTRSRPSR